MIHMSFMHSNSCFCDHGKVKYLNNILNNMFMILLRLRATALIHPRLVQRRQTQKMSRLAMNINECYLESRAERPLR
jgi:hypothetical protein